MQLEGKINLPNDDTRSSHSCPQYSILNQAYASFLRVVHGMCLLVDTFTYFPGFSSQVYVMTWSVPISRLC